MPAFQHLPSDLVIYRTISKIMANADSPDPTKDLVPVNPENEEVEPLAPPPEPKLPTRKDASLKEFLSKMDDYAPIVSYKQTYISKSKAKPRFPMPLQTTISQKLVFHHHHRQTRDLRDSLLLRPKSSLPILLLMPINILEFVLQILQMRTIPWAT